MRFNTIELRPLFKRDTRTHEVLKWLISHREDDRDREDMATVPFPVGWYHYPVSIPKKKAFRMLKQCITKSYKDGIANMKATIANMEKALVKLDALEME